MIYNENTAEVSSSAPSLRMFDGFAALAENSIGKFRSGSSSLSYSDHSSLFEKLEQTGDGSEDNNSLSPLAWQTYNFEVDDLHTYIASDFRVHNTSLLDLVPRDAINIVPADTNGDGVPDTASYQRPGGVNEIIRGWDENGDGHTDLIDRTATIPRIGLLGPGDKIVWQERYDRNASEPVEKKIVGIDYAAGSLQGEEIGRTLGSVLGTAVSGKNIFAQVGGSTIAATLMQNVGEFLHKGIDLSILDLDGHKVSPLEVAISDTFKDFKIDLQNNLKIQVLNSLSGVIVGELADSLGLNGFQRGLFNTVGSTVTNQVLANAAYIAAPNIAPLPPGVVVNSNVNLLSGFEFTNMTTNLANSLGGFFGSYLGTEAIRPRSSQSALFGSATAAVGSYVGTALGTAVLGSIPFVGPLIGAFAGQALGNMVGNALWDDDRRAHYTIFTAENGTVQYGYPFTQDGASLVLSQHMASTISNSINEFFNTTGTSISYDQAFEPFRVGWYVNSQNQKVMFAVDTNYQVPFDLNSAQGLIASSVNHAVSHSEISGADVIIRRAYHVSKGQGLAQLGFDLQVAKDYKKYIENTKLINTMISESPKSEFSVGWIATLQRASELGLNRAANFDPMEYLAANQDLQTAIGLNKEAATRHFINAGINENRNNSFDSYEYLAANPGLSNALGGIDREKAALHYIQSGRTEGRATKINRYSYLASHKDLWTNFSENSDALFRNVIEHGARQVTFDAAAYLADNPDLQGEYGGDVEGAARHYLRTGQQERRRAFHKGSVGPDSIRGGLGGDSIAGSLGSDTLFGDQGSDEVFGNEDADVIYGNKGADSLYGGQGPDQLYGGQDADLVYGNIGADVLLGNQGEDTLYGGDDADVLYGNEDADLVYGNRGSDTLYGGQGPDKLYGGADNDVISGNIGSDIVYGNLGMDTLYGGEDADALYGNEDADIIYGNQGADFLHGGQGSDKLYGGADSDILVGGAGDDMLIGGVGANRYVFSSNSGNDIIIGFNQAAGDRIVLSGQSYGLGSSSNGGAVLFLSGGGRIEINGISASQINGGYFAAA